MGLIPNEIISAVLDRSDIAAVVGRYVPLKKAGRNFKALCPFHHEKSPSFVVNPDKQIFHCFGCGAGGNAIGFVMRQERLDFPDAVRLLAEQCGVTIETASGEADNPSRQLREEIYKVNGLAVGYFHELLLSSREPAAKNARDYLKNRGVSLEIARQFQLGFAADEWEGLSTFLKQKGVSPELMQQAGLTIAREKGQGFYDRFRNRIVFPIFDIQSRPVAFGARTMVKEEGAKYINSPETPVYTKGRHMFGLNLTKTAVGKLDQAIVVEGYMDMIMPFVHGVENIAASQGTALTAEQIRLIRRYTQNVVMLFDTDPAGQNAIVRSLDLLVEEGMNVRIVTLSATAPDGSVEGHDPDSYIRKYGVEAFRLRLDQAQSLFDYKLSRLAAQYGEDTIEGRAKICREMMGTINRYRDEVVKFELTKALSDHYKIPVEVITKQSPTAVRSVPSVPVPVKTEPTVPIRLSRAEELLLSLFLSDPQWVRQAAQVVTPEDFSVEAQGIVRRLWPLAEKEEWSPGDALAGLQEPSQQVLAGKLLSMDEKLFVEPQRIFEDCVKKIQKNRLEREQKEHRRSGDFQSAIEIIKQIKS